MAKQHPGPNRKHVRPIGGYVLSDEPLELNAGRPVTEVVVQNTGDRPIQVGSHFHFFEVNRYLEFDRRGRLRQAPGHSGRRPPSASSPATRRR